MYAQHAKSTLGISKKTTGYWSHSIQNREEAPESGGPFTDAGRTTDGETLILHLDLSILATAHMSEWMSSTDCGFHLDTEVLVVPLHTVFA